MYNWRLLIFAFFAVFQPIASFAERNLVDGRDQCCDHRLSRDSGRLNGNYPFKLPVEDRRLNYHREIREERRYETRNERVVLNQSPTNGFRDARERQLNRDFGSRVSRTTFQRNNNRVAPPDTRETREERNFVRDSLSRRIAIATTERRDLRNAETISRYVNRETNQREVSRQMPKDNADARRETRPEPRRTTDSDRRSYHERSAVRDLDRRISVTRQDLRHQRLTMQKPTQPLNRFKRDNNQYRRSSVTGYRVPDELRNTHTEIRETRNEAARDDVRISDRIDRVRKLSSRSLDRRSDNGRSYRKTVAASNNRLSAEIRNFEREERRMDGRNMREIKERFGPTRTVIFQRIDSNSEKNTERLTPAERSRNISPLRHSRVDNLESIRAAIKLTTGEERRESNHRMLATRSENRQNENRRERTHLTSRNREMHVVRRNSIDDLRQMSNRRTLSLDRSYEQRTRRSERENARAFDESRQRDERKERRMINERTLSLERERISDVAHRMERGVSLERRLRERATYEANRVSSRNLDMIRNNLSEKNRNNIRNTESRPIDNRMKSARDHTHNPIHKMEQNEFDTMNWQYLMYTMQGIYLCTIFLPMLMDKGASKKKMSLNWGASVQKLIKVD